MRSISRTAALVLGCCALLCADAQAQQGKAVFEGKGNCHTCHGKNARGTPLGPNLTDGEWLNIDGSLAAIRTLVRQGVDKPKKYPAPMPAMGGAKLSDAEIEAVAAYVFGLRTAPDAVPQVRADRPAGAPRAAPRAARR